MVATACAGRNCLIVASDAWGYTLIMVEFPEDDFVRVESAVDGIDVFRPKSSAWRLPSATNTLPDLNPVTLEPETTPINLSRTSAILMVALPLLLSMAMMLWQEFYQRSDPLSLTAIAAGLFLFGIALALFFTLKTMRGSNG